MKKVKYIFYITVVLILIGILMERYVVKVGDANILNYKNLTKSHTAIILGAGIIGNHPTHILRDRLNVGLELYKNGKVKKILVTGDHGRKSYNEVRVMKDYLMKNGVKEKDIFMDHAGFSTYESMVRAKKIFNIKNAIIITQHYHLKRAVFLAKSLGIDAKGVRADKRVYDLMLYYKLREMVARTKDFLYVKIFKFQPKYLGEKIDINGDGRVTDDKYKTLS